MNAEINLRESIKTALAECGGGDFLAAAENLLNKMEYSSTRKTHLSGKPADFIKEFPARNENTKSEERFITAAKSVRVIFQYSESEIEEACEGAQQSGLGMQYGAMQFNQGEIYSFLFAAVELKAGDYSRGKYAEFTREINKRFGMPVVVFFRKPGAADARMTFAFAGRRQHKIDDSRDVLEKVSLLREINCENPHRGHVDILAELSFERRLKWIQGERKPENFDGLLAAWLDELDTEALNRRFYKDLSGWFGLAAGQVERPKDAIKLPAHLRAKKEDWIIRLITRLLFIWFIKEKNLVAEELFIKAKIEGMLKNGINGNSYYRVILQNLFFATLNTPFEEMINGKIEKRRFSRKNRDDHRNFRIYRYRDEIAKGRESDLLAYFAKTPFINGGLFDCLDDYEGIMAGGKRIDYFSDAHGKEISVPDSLFFGENGLLPLFNRYKFTVEENTPIEQEVALDPELLGKVLRICSPPTTPKRAKMPAKKPAHIIPRAKLWII